MLNRALVLEQLQEASADLFMQQSNEYALAQASWQRIIKDPAFAYKIRQITTPWLIPDWYDPLSQVIEINPTLDCYTVLGVDGSQVYPDKHQGTSCFLINIGTIIVHYGQNKNSAVSLNSQPYLFAKQENENQQFNGQDLVDCKRQEYELQQGYELARNLQAEVNVSNIPLVFLLDGSLIFWHLESKDKALKEFFLHKYLQILEQLYQAKILCAGYISLPKSKELVNLVRIELCNFKIEDCTLHEAVNHIVDSTIASFFLPANTRSIVFKSNAKIGAYYFPHLVPHFFYLNVGEEIVRIEIPAWTAQNEMLVDQVAQVILNQAIKGRGYPVALAEAHEQAVIKGPDRDFFYHLITKLAIEHKRQLIVSQKSMKKRGIGI